MWGTVTVYVRELAVSVGSALARRVTMPLVSNSGSLVLRPFAVLSLLSYHLLF